MDKEQIKPDADVICVVFPVYLSFLNGCPLIVKRFINKLTNIEGKYIFAVCTHMGSPMITVKNFSNLIEERGGKLSCGFLVLMPGNESKTKENKKKKMFDNWKNEKLGYIVNYIEQKKNGRYENRGEIIHFLFGWLIKLIINNGMNILRKLINSESSDYNEMLPKMDKYFTVSNNCVSCGTCEKVCPNGNIKLLDEKPTWHNRCELCLACYSWCPENAINNEYITSKITGFQYRHPEAALSDFIRK